MIRNVLSFDLLAPKRLSEPMEKEWDKAHEAILKSLGARKNLGGDYEIEVSSPGIDRPLTRLMDFARWAGHEAKIELHNPIEGRKRFRGLLMGLDGQDVSIRADNTDIKFPFRAIANAKLVLTDKLINEDLKARKDVQERPRERERQ